MNMKSIIVVGSILLASTPGVYALDDMGLEGNQIVVGHTITNDIDSDDECFGEAGKYTLGARLTADELAPYAGCEIVGMRFAIGVDQSRTRAFINRVDGSDVYDVVSKNINAKAGWNNISFSEAITIKTGDSFFYGFDYNETAEMALSDKGAICSVSESDSNGAFVMMDHVLYPVLDIGNLCVQLIVDVTNQTPLNMNISYIDTGFKYNSMSDRFNLYANISNAGRDPIHKFRIGWAFDGFDPEYLDVNESVAPGAYFTIDRKLNYPAGFEVGQHSFRIFIDEIEGSPAPDDGVKERTVSFAAYNKSEERKKVYVEVYAHPETPYSALLNDVTSTYPDADNVATFVNVYPVGTELECNISEELHKRYAFTYPCFSSNRSLFPGETTVAYDFNDYLTVFPAEFFHYLFEDIIYNDLLSPSFANLELKGSYDPANRTATVRAEVASLPEEVSEIFGNLALNLLVVENGVKAPQMIYNRLGAEAKENKYSHPNVLRQACFGIDGKKVENSKETSVIEQTIKFPVEWNEKNIRIVGLLTPWHDSNENVNIRDFDIINCNELNVTDMVSSVSEIESDIEVYDEYFTLTGIRSSASAPGIYMQRTSNGWRKIIKK